jgi:DnaJ like chaperone protein
LIGPSDEATAAVPVPRPHFSRPAPAVDSIAFTTAVIALGAKMARADGVVVPIETEAFHKVFRTAPDERSNVERVYRLAQADTAGYETYAHQIRTLLHGDSALLREVLACLLYVATIDRLLHPKEDEFLAEVAAIFAVPKSEWRYIRAQVVEDHASPYDVLGLTPDDDDATVVRRYRKLVRENHPDLLIGRGMPEDVIVVANKKLAHITEAYTTIAKERGL